MLNLSDNGRAVISFTLGFIRTEVWVCQWRGRYFTPPWWRQHWEQAAGSTRANTSEKHPV